MRSYDEMDLVIAKIAIVIALNPCGFNLLRFCSKQLIYTYLFLHFSCLIKESAIEV